MGLQTWRIEDIENIMGGIHAVALTTTATLTNDGQHEDYRQGFHHGFETTLQQVTTSFDNKWLPQGIAFQQDVADILVTIQAIMRGTVAGMVVQNHSTDYLRGFNQGLETALWCIAATFGIDLLPPSNDIKLIRESVVESNPYWFREDIDNILLALQAVMSAILTAAKQEGLADYQRGFEDTLRSAAKSLHVKLPFLQNGFPTPNTASSFDHFRLRDDIKSNLQTVYLTMKTIAAASKFKDRSIAYNHGFEMAAQCIATAFRINLSV